jgi:C4-type Zn-finger protein
VGHSEENPSSQMNCPICKHVAARRSRRQSTADYILSAVGVYPWRCKSCRGRFHARLMPLSNSLHAHCPLCGNLALKRISPEHVDCLFGFVWRNLRIPAFRCEPCRHKYFSILPLHHRVEREAEVSSGD